ncbi:MAG: EAL domain-containing protein [Nannocystaceae bacterium]
MSSRSGPATRRKLSYPIGGFEQVSDTANTRRSAQPAAAKQPATAGHDHQQGRKPLLVVDDEPAVLRVFGTILRHAGFDTELARSGAEARDLVRENTYDAIVSDVRMPDINGIALIKQVRHIDLDVPVILMTGAPTVDTAMEAVALGAFRYLAKPVRSHELATAVDEAVKLHDLARIRRKTHPPLGTQVPSPADLAELDIVFRRAVDRIRLVCQPIVDLSRRRFVAYEALLRSDEPALATPLTLLHAAEQLERLPEVDRRVRELAAQHVARLPADVDMHVNLHPIALDDPSLYDATAPLTQVAHRIVLEITEQQRLSDPTRVGEQMAALRRLGYRVALDDLGAGHAGLTSIVTLHPETVKLDMALVRDIHRRDTQATIVGRVVDLCGDLGLTLIAEGVEVREELDTLVELGCNLFQGYDFARPQPHLVSEQNVFEAVPAPVPARKADA